MQQVLPRGQFISGKPGTETAQCPFTDRLVFKTCGMKRVLIPEIKLAGLCELFICEVGEILQDQRTDKYIDRSIWSGIHLFTVQWGKDVLIDPCEDMIGKSLCP